MLDIMIEDPRWNDVSFPDLAQRVVCQSLAELGLNPDICEVSLLGCDDARISELNAEFRGKPVPTNVLSWPENDLAAELAGHSPDLPDPDFTGMCALGDIAISWDTCSREADAAGKELDAHISHLLVHGLLHLLGYDHIRDEDATLMERLEARILGKMGIADPYMI